MNPNRASSPCCRLLDRSTAKGSSIPSSFCRGCFTSDARQHEAAAGGVKGLSRGSGEPMDDAAHLRIGEFSYRVGISPDVLRAWEKRYGLLRPSRSAGGYRLYSERDEWRVRLMQQKLWSGLSTAEAARDVARLEQNSDMPDGSIETPAELAEKVGAALERFDED